MKIQFIYGKINLQTLQNIDVLISPTDESFSASGGLDQAIRAAAGPDLAAALHCRHLDTGHVLLTEGFNLGVKHIAHAAIPRRRMLNLNKLSGKENPLQECCQKILGTIGAPGGGPNAQILCKTAAVTLLGTGHCGWTYQESMEALWQAVLAYHRNHGSAYFGKGQLEKLLIYYPQEAHEAVYPYMYRASQAFFRAPDQWGWRGDPYLWYDLMEHFDDPKFNRIDLRAFIGEIQRFFHKKAGVWLCSETEVMLEEYAHGGMSSGGISSFMAEIGIPLLCSNLVELGFLEDQKPHFVIPVELQCMHQEKYQLKLPYELLPDLTHLRSKKHEMNDQRRISLDLERVYYLTVHHYHNMPELIDFYSLDVELADDSHYEFSEEKAGRLCRKLGFKPVALGAALSTYLREHGGAALEALVRSVADKEFHYG